MKTPRELILGHHQSAESKLKAIGAKDLADYARSAATASAERRPSFSLACVARQFWREALWPWRRAWIGVVAGWVVILALDLGTHDTPITASARPSRPNPEVMAVLKQQEQLLTQLLGTGTARPSRARVPGPRSAAEPPNAAAQNISHGALACCRPIPSEWSKPATCRRSVHESVKYAT